MSAGRHAARRVAVLVLTGAVPAAVLAGCAPTTYDASVTTTVADDAAATTSTLPSGPATELLPRLVDEAAGLSALILDGGDDQAAARRIAELWAAVSQEVASNRPELLGDFEANVARCKVAADRNRAADADKAFLALDALTDAYLA
jgi:hypothetical protein